MFRAFVFFCLSVSLIVFHPCCIRSHCLSFFFLLYVSPRLTANEAWDRFRSKGKTSPYDSFNSRRKEKEERERGKKNKTHSFFLLERHVVDFEVEKKNLWFIDIINCREAESDTHDTTYGRTGDDFHDWLDREMEFVQKMLGGRVREGVKSWEGAVIARIAEEDEEVDEETLNLRHPCEWDER